MNKRLKILWLPAWYPSKVDFLNGDFVQRHALAVSKFVDVVIISFVRDESLTNTTTLIEIEEKQGLCVYSGYYNSSKKNIISKKIMLGFLYFKLFFKLFKIANKQHGKFDLVHVHISLKQSIFAIFLKFSKGIKYVITEHNGWYMPIGNKQFTNNFFLKKLIKSSFKYSSKMSVVSNSLGLALRNKYKFIKNFLIIPNVVDTFFFITKRKYLTQVL